MNMNEFQFSCGRTWGKGGPDPLQNAALGLAGEAGEVANEVKKNRYQGHRLDDKKIIEELGDVLFYVAVAAMEIGVSLEEVAAANINKLKGRYPDGFDPIRSQKRDE